MDEVNLAKTISEQVVSDTKFWIALIGIIGGIVGAALKRTDFPGQLN